MVNAIFAFPHSPTSSSLPFYGSHISAGFPSPADDFIEKTLDLNTYLVQHPAATFFVRVSGDSMVNAGIFDGDLLIVDRSLEPISGKIVVAAIHGELTVKRLIRKNNQFFLQPENLNYPVIEIKEEENMHIWGVVTSVIHAV